MAIQCPENSTYFWHYDQPSKMELVLDHKYAANCTLTEVYSVWIVNNWNIDRICFQIHFPKTAAFDPKDLHYIIDR